MNWSQLLNNQQPFVQTSLEQLINNQPSNLLYPLQDFSVLAVTGPDRYSFLQGQVTCDSTRLENDENLLGACLNLQGRIEASFIAFTESDRILLLLPSQQREHLKSLWQKYVLFSQVSLEDEDTLFAYLFWSNQADASQGYSPPQSSDVNLNLANQAQISQLLDSHTLGNPNEAMAVTSRNGLYLVEENQRGSYLPQELNYDQNDGISFNKGCYKGQEVVARIHFKGQVKQRLIGFYSPVQTQPGASVFHSQKKCGEVIQAIPMGQGCCGCLLVKTSESESKALCLEQNDGPELQLLAPPYAIT